MNNTVEKNMAVGIDLSDDFSEISYIDRSDMNVVTYRTGDDEEKFEIPTLACKMPGEEGGWCFGEEAISASQEYGVELIDSLVHRAIIGKPIYIDQNEKADPVRLLGMFVTYVLLYPSEINPQGIASLVITTESIDPALPAIFEKILTNIRSDISEIRYISHAESFFYYALNQPIELWRDGVMLFDYNRAHFKMSSLVIDSSARPAIVMTEEKSYEDMVPFVEENAQLYDNIFREISENEMMNKRLSAVYLTGSSFGGRWADKTFRFLCSRARVFVGQNLYTKGACYAAADLVGWTRLGSRYIFMDETRINTFIGIRASDGVREDVIPLISPGISWYDINASAEFMLGTDRRISLVIRGSGDENEREAVIRCDWIPERPERTTRIRLDITCPKNNRLNCKVTDLGFGEIFPSAGLSREEIIELL
ncbi:MAG: hypothetical protein K6F39_07640 [Lachnospiraceae bacterium]|nr:hypothetical protein [Lachnospiraceae bacterium]